MEDVEPYPFGRPAYEAVVQRFARAVDERRIRPAATGLQHMDNAADDPAIIHSRLSRRQNAVHGARIDDRSARNDLDPCRFPFGDFGSENALAGNPFYGSAT